MNKLEANLTLLCVTFFWGIQYVFLGNIPDDISTFAFLCLTNAIGFVIVAAVFFREFSQLTVKAIKTSALLAILLFGMNGLLTAGSRGLDASVSSFLAAAYIVFVPLVMRFFKKRATKENIAGIVMAIAGLLLATGPEFSGGIKPGIAMLLGADVLFAVYVVVVENVAKDSNPVLLSMGQMAFGALFGLAGWLIVQPSTVLNLPADSGFWGSVLVLAVFVRGFSTVMQVYAQRYVSALNASLIFSTEIIFTMLTSLFLPVMLGGEPEEITLPKALGCACIVAGVLVSDGALRLKRRAGAAKRQA